MDPVMLSWGRGPDMINLTILKPAPDHMPAMWAGSSRPHGMGRPRRGTGRRSGIGGSGRRTSRDPAIAGPWRALTHAGFRTWCPHCLRGRGRNSPHSSVRRAADAVLVLTFNYYFLGFGRGESAETFAQASGLTPVLVMHGDHSNGVYAPTPCRIRVIGRLVIPPGRFQG